MRFLPKKLYTGCKMIKIPASPSVRRLPSYLHIIRQAHIDGYEYISGTIIAQELQLEPIQVRKDLAITGIVGKPKRGYPVVALISAIEHFLGWDNKNKAIIVGAGNLATALTGYSEFEFHGLEFVCAFDTDPEKIGKKIHGVPIYSMASIKTQVKKLNAAIAIITVPSQFAQETADMVVETGIKAIWNFTNVKLTLPKGVVSQREDLTSGYAMLSVKMIFDKEKRVLE
jgi:redox-sensing transcriptional repressor